MPRTLQGIVDDVVQRMTATWQTSDQAPPANSTSTGLSPGAPSPKFATGFFPHTTPANHKQKNPAEAETPDSEAKTTAQAQAKPRTLRDAAACRAQRQRQRQRQRRDLDSFLISAVIR